jgi:hypothetical protein
MHFFSLATLLVAATSIVSANPTGQINKRTPAAASTPSLPNPSTCDLSAAKMPVGTLLMPFSWMLKRRTTDFSVLGSTPLPTPSGTLTHVFVGRGTQNYTCADNKATTTPVAVGALASLFNATCLAGPFPSLLAVMPGIALRFPVPSSTDANDPAEALLAGHHFFSNSTTAVFNLDTNLHKWGVVSCKKVGAVPAPNPTTDVPWLRLTALSADGCSLSEVYRVNTAGGQPPKTCAGMASKFEVQYAAEYWLYSASTS